MKPEEIKTFLDLNSDLFGPGLGEYPVIDTVDIPELFKRLFESREFKQKFVKLNEIINFPAAPDPKLFVYDKTYGIIAEATVRQEKNSELK